MRRKRPGEPGGLGSKRVLQIVDLGFRGMGMGVGAFEFTPLAFEVLRFRTERFQIELLDPVCQRPVLLMC